jgi:uncharacterized alkaline shock family protein YloU
VAKIMDRLLLFIYSLSVGIISIYGIFLFSSHAYYYFDDFGHGSVFLPGVVVAAVLALLSLRFFYISIRRDRRRSLRSIDQRTEFGDIQISLETIENLSHKAVARIRGIKDVKTRIRVTEKGLEINVRALVDGEMAIPPLTEEVQKQVHDYVGEITGIPVSYVSVYIANLVQSTATKARVE